jgi:UDP-N-acetylmuramate--alanine ligase
VLFQPHRYTRTRDLKEEFAQAFHDADTLFLLDIYAANEPPIEGVTAEALAEEIRDVGEQDARYVPTVGDAVDAICDAAQPGDMILTLGAGSVSQLGPMILEKLQTKQRT